MRWNTFLLFLFIGDAFLAFSNDGALAGFGWVVAALYAVRELAGGTVKEKDDE